MVKGEGGFLNKESYPKQLKEMQEEIKLFFKESVGENIYILMNKSKTLIII